MPGPLSHAPADIISRLIVDLGEGVDSETLPLGEWPVYVGVEPDVPDDVVTVFDRIGDHQGREHITGRVFQYEGFQVRVRSATYEPGYEKIRCIAVELDRTVYDNIIVIDGTTYKIHSVTRESGPFILGKQVVGGKRGTRRDLFTLNCKAAITINA